MIPLVKQQEIEKKAKELLKTPPQVKLQRQPIYKLRLVTAKNQASLLNLQLPEVELAPQRFQPKIKVLDFNFDVAQLSLKRNPQQTIVNKSLLENNPWSNTHSRYNQMKPFKRADEEEKGLLEKAIKPKAKK